MKSLTYLSLTALALLLNSCAIVTAPVKIATKAATTSIGVAGKATGAGIRAMSDSEGPQSATVE